MKPEIADLLDWYRDREAAGEHPVIVAATFHYRFVRIHPFDDGNGRMARLLMNLILIKYGYSVAIVQSDDKPRYLQELERADQSEDLTQFIEFVASRCTYALDLYLRAARGESIDAPEDIDQEIALFKSSVVRSATADDRVALRQYVETVAFPAYQYFASKVWSIASDVSLSKYGPVLDIEGLDVDGKVLQTRVDGNVEDPSNVVDLRVLPEHASKVTIRFVFEIQSFQNTEKMILYYVDNFVEPGRVVWRLRLEGSHSHAIDEYNGQDLHDIGMKIRELLSFSMNLMQEWANGGG